jgi:hypothetical protein
MNRSFEKCVKNIIRKSEGKEELGKLRSRLDDNIRMNDKLCLGRMWTGFIWLRIWTIGGLL